MGENSERIGTVIEEVSQPLIGMIKSVSELGVWEMTEKDMGSLKGFLSLNYYFAIIKMIMR